MDEFILRALLAGIAVAMTAGGLGVFIIWRRMAYFGDTLSHASLLGVSLGYVLGISLNVGIIIVSLFIALSIVLLQRRRSMSDDTLLGILAHSALSLALVLMAFIEGVRVDLNAWLFGDILAVSWADLAMLALVMAIVLAVLFNIWKPLLSMTVHEELAKVEGVNITLVGAVYTLLLALTVAVAMKVIGALLISSMLIIPAAAARKLVRSPEMMVLFAMLLGVLAVVFGLALSYFQDTPAGPSIVAMASLLFVILHILPAKWLAFNNV